MIIQVQDSKFVESITLQLKDATTLSFKFIDVIFDDTDQFVFKAKDIENRLYAFTNEGCLRFKNIDYGTLRNGENQVSIEISKNGETICSDTITVIAETEGQITLPEVTVNSESLLNGVTAINTQGEVVVGNIENSIINETEDTVSISRGYLEEDKVYQISTYDAEGFIFNNLPKFATQVKIIPFSLTANVQDFSYLFNGYSKLTSVPSFDTSNATSLKGLFYGCSSLTSAPELNTSKVTDFSKMFNGCSKLSSVPLFDTSNATSFSEMFDGCSKLSSVPSFNTSNVNNFWRCFRGCQSLTTIPLFDTSNVNRFEYLFDRAYSLQEVPAIDTSKATSFSYIFYYCTALVTLPQFNVANVTTFDAAFYQCSSLTNFGGLLNAKVSFDLSYSKNLTHQSLLNVLNGLADLTGSTSKTCTLGSANLAKLTDAEKAIATNKNWVLA